MKTRHSSVPIAERASPSVLKSKSSSSPGVIPMNPSAVCRVVRPGSPNAPEVAAEAAAEAAVVMATVLPARCSRQYAPSAAKILKFRSNPGATDRFTAVIATAKSDPSDKVNLS